MTPRTGTQSYSAPASGSSITLPANGYLTVSYRAGGNNLNIDNGFVLHNLTSNMGFTGNEGDYRYPEWVYYVTAYGRKGDKIKFTYAYLLGIDSVVFTYAGEVS